MRDNDVWRVCPEIVNDIGKSGGKQRGGERVERRGQGERRIERESEER